MAYEQLSIQELVNIAIDKDILLDPELLKDKQKIISELRKLEGPKRGSVKIIQNYTKPPKKWNVQDFVKHFKKRYEQIGSILRTRKELQSITSINRLIGKRERERVSLIGLVNDKNETKNKHISLKMEDPTGMIDVWINANNRELIEQAKEIVLDECIGIVGQTSNGRIFAEKLFFPDIPLHKELKKGPKEEYVVFVGDIEVGAKLFMQQEFEHLIMWLNGKLGNEEQKHTASKVSYVVLIGDLVHGAGVYPNQHLDQKEGFIDVQKQYDELARYIKMIPEHIQILMIGGNHDIGRLQEPQLPLYKDIAKKLYELPNVTITSNPSMVNIAQTKDFPGFDLLLYHGYSLIYYSDTIQPIREKGGQACSDDIMKVLLKKRHLAPSHGSNTYVPDPDEDPMVIDKIPDIFVTGHIHRIAHDTYNGVTILNCGAWNSLSDEQIRRGLQAEPAKLPMLNLKNRQLKIMNFNFGGNKDE